MCMNYSQKNTKKEYNLPTKTCVGCGSCVVCCPKNAITLKNNSLALWLPNVNLNECINCGICVQKCPVINRAREKHILSFYVAQSNKANDVLGSSSGGVFFTLAKHFIKNGYCVVGAVYTHDFRRVHHIIAETENDLQNMRGSKYAKSDVSSIYRSLMSLAKQGKKILFSGVGCECAAVKILLKDYLDNVFICQLVCKGNMSPLVLSCHIDYMEKKYSEKIVSYTMRYKKKGLGSPAPAYEKIIFSNGMELCNEYYKTIHGVIFASNALLANVCFNCKFRGNDSVGDIVIGDYSRYQSFDREKMGSSLVVIRSEKGKKTFEIIKDSFFIQPIYQKNLFKTRFFVGPKRPWLLNTKKMARFISNGSYIRAYMYVRKFSHILRIQRFLQK